MKDELTHFGVKGMKWGVRKDDIKSTASALVAKVKQNARGSDDHQAVKNYYKKGGKQLSNKELLAAMYRMNLEQNYKRLQYERMSFARKTAQKWLEKRTRKMIEKNLDSVFKMASGANIEKIREKMKQARADPEAFEKEMQEWTARTAENIKRGQEA